MDTIKLQGEVFHGTHYGSVGVYTDARRATYAGEHKNVVAHGHGVVTWSNGHTWSGQFADGRWHGHMEDHRADGDVGYALYERDRPVLRARVYPDGDCFYDGEPCGADHAGHAALKAAAQQAGVRMPP
jgi:hypothetical protein